jgi:hypothetical protein
MRGKKLNDKLKEINENMIQFEKDFNIAYGHRSSDHGIMHSMSSVYSGIKALYQQNEILIEQNKGINEKYGKIVNMLRGMIK